MKVEQIFTAVEELRKVSNDGPATRKLLDALFRDVHSLKANASANGLNDLASAAHEFENVLHSLRKNTLQQSIAEGAKLFLVQPDFDVADFDLQFRTLKETLSKTGEVISTSPRVNKERPRKVSFSILYARKAEASQIRAELPNITVEEIAPPPATNEFQTHAPAFEHSFRKLSAELVKLPAIPFAGAVEQALQAGRSVALATGKEVDFELRGEELKSLDEVVADPLVHLVRNAVDHGIESSDERVKLGKNPRGKIVIEVVQLEGQTRITVTDDGRGIDPASLPLIFSSGFSTAPETTEISGRGVGLDAVKTIIEEAGGSVSVSSQLGHGSTFELTLPL